MKRVTMLIALLAIGALSAAIAAIQAPGGQRGPQEPNVAKIEKVKDNLYMIAGGGGNTAAFITDRGVVVVDTKLAGWGQPILDKIKTVSNKPVVMIINTHSHPDHVGSNEAFPATADIVAQENTKANMVKLDAFKGDKAKFLTKKTFKDKMTLNESADANNDFVAWVQSEMKAGKTVDQAAAEWKTPAKFPSYGPPAPLFGGIKGNIQAAYNELKK